MTATWHSLRLTYYADQDHLICTAVDPFFAAVRDEAEPFYFLRHWRQGPHLRLNFRCEPQAFRDIVEPTAETVLGEYLREHPSRAALNEANSRETHEKLARDEQETGPLTPWYADNGLATVPYQHRGHVLNADEAAMLAEFYDRTNGLAFAMTRAVLNGESRARLAFDLMVATAHALSGMTIERGFVSFRSHSEAHLSGDPDGEPLRRAWATQYAAQGTQLRARLRAVLSAIDSGDGSIPHVRDWLATVAPLAHEARARIARGAMTLDGSRADAGAPRPASPQPDTAYQRWMAAHRQERFAVESAPWFLAYRWLLNCTYLHLRRIGLVSTGRFLLCTLVADAVEDEFGVRAFDIVRELLSESTPTAAHEAKGA